MMGEPLIIKYGNTRSLFLLALHPSTEFNSIEAVFKCNRLNMMVIQSSLLTTNYLVFTEWFLVFISDSLAMDLVLCVPQQGLTGR